MSDIDTKKALDFIIQAAEITSDLLKSYMNDYLSQNTKNGKTTYDKLASTGKLESIEITENNIADFEDVSRKYDVRYSLKRDSGTVPPTYHVYFQAADTETFRRAFAEYATNASEKTKTVISKEKIRRVAKKVNEKYEQQNREKSAERARDSYRDKSPPGH